MKRIAVTAFALACVLATPAWAALKAGDTAPVFTAQAALDGKDYVFSLAEALKKGPVVLYFFPKAFTTGCTAEAHAFAEAAEQLTAMGASLIGMSAETSARCTNSRYRLARASFRWLPTPTSRS